MTRHRKRRASGLNKLLTANHNSPQTSLSVLTAGLYLLVVVVVVVVGS